jgi:hypothetical protein
MKKTAVQEVIDYIEGSTKIKFKDTSKDTFNDMHKYQITEAIEHVLAGFITNDYLRCKIAEKYYNDTYSDNKNNEE